MLDINYILKNTNKLIKNLKYRKYNKIYIINKIILYKKKEKNILKEIQINKRLINEYSKIIF
ncbi:MAG: hypothetical protein NHG07_00510 [Candidatus Shikimatogenerans bostrichidophilus]|nr:MAG: hypothetical protein NHG07_00510 [Candidatus Shikimatogenerans bostrichidophilus]